MTQLYGSRFLTGLRVIAGELGGVRIEPADTVAEGLEIGNAKVGDGDGDGIPGAIGDAAGVMLPDGEGLCVRVGVGEGIMFSQ